MNDIGTQILIGVVVTVISGLILAGLYFLFRLSKDKLKEKWKDMMFRLSTSIAIGGALFVFGTFFSFLLFSIEQAILLIMSAVGLFIISFTFAYFLIQLINRLSERIKELEDKLKENNK